MKRESIGLALLLVAAAWQSAPADLSFAMTTIGNPGNAADAPYPDPDVHVGAVSYVYRIGTYEVTVAQYTEFLNAVAASDPHGLYHGDMGTGFVDGGATITRTGSEGSYSYNAVTGKENQPVRLVSFYDGLRLCNWLANGQGNGDTETGSYDLSLGMYVTRSAGATWVLPSEDEWHKAAYYDAGSETYREYPNGKDAISEPTDQTTPRELNFGDLPYWQGSVVFTSIGETTGRSAYGVCDMGGNVAEWTDSLVPPAQGYNRVVKGGSFVSAQSYLTRAGGMSEDPSVEWEGQGLRLAFIIPEPNTLALLVLGSLAAAFEWTRRGRH